MFIKPKNLLLSNGQTLTLRSPVITDAGAVLELMRITSEETHFMSRYPEEIKMTEEMEAQLLKEVQEDQDNFMIAAFIEGELAGNAGVQRVDNRLKYRHRGEFGICIKAKYWNLGLGTLILKEVRKTAESTGFDQIELGVFSDNTRAVHLYEKMGFEKTGTVPRAYKLKDGRYCDEIQMVYIIK